LKKETNQPNRILTAHILLIFLCLGVGIYYVLNKKHFDSNEQKSIKKVFSFSIVSTFIMLLFGVLFMISPILLYFESLYMFACILFPAYALFYIVIYFIGLSELRKGRKFVYPFVGAIKE
jgi:amino acid transporter